MPYRLYKPWKPQRNAQRMLQLCNGIITEYAAAGYDLTLRQLYYQMVARGHIENTFRSYKNLGDIVNNGRLAGMLDWSHINDRTRNLEDLAHWRDPEQILRAIADQFRHAKWEAQPTRVEVWVEKEALAGVIERVAQRYDVPWFSCRGYVSQSEMWNAAQRLRGYVDNGQNVVILHLGDHDPSGIDMSRDIADRIATFMEVDVARDQEYGGSDEEHTTEWARDEARMKMNEWINEARYANFRARNGRGPHYDDHDENMQCMLYGDVIEVRRIALNMDQVRQYAPPPNPAKMTDSRVEDYIRLYGRESWELDALDPPVLDALIAGEIDEIIDVDAWNTSLDEENAEKSLLEATSARWPAVKAFLADTPEVS